MFGLNICHSLIGEKAKKNLEIIPLLKLVQSNSGGTRNRCNSTFFIPHRDKNEKGRGRVQHIDSRLVAVLLEHY
jgi:hypothetical protein